MPGSLLLLFTWCRHPRPVDLNQGCFLWPESRRGSVRIRHTRRGNSNPIKMPNTFPSCKPGESKFRLQFYLAFSQEPLFRQDGKANQPQRCANLKFNTRLESQEIRLASIHSKFPLGARGRRVHGSHCLISCSFALWLVLKVCTSISRWLTCWSFYYEESRSQKQ